MTNQQHPITPPPELVEQWIAQVWHEGTPVKVAASDLHVATQSARWGADQELEACCEYIAGPGRWFVTPQSRLAELRAVRRPKPPSLAEEALEALDRMDQLPTAKDQHLIRAALERLQELENGNE